METTLNSIIQIIAFATAIAGAVIGAYMTLKSKIKEGNFKTVSDKLDLIPVIGNAVLASEKEFNGYNKNCGKCGDPEQCSQYGHSKRKLEFAMRIVMDYCKEHKIEFKFDYVKSKIEELLLTAKQFQRKD